MNVIYPIHKVWADKILSGDKPFEFRTKLPRKLTLGSKIFIYETKNNNGAGAVVGECVVNDIWKLLLTSSNDINSFFWNL